MPEQRKRADVFDVRRFALVTERLDAQWRIRRRRGGIDHDEHVHVDRRGGTVTIVRTRKYVHANGKCADVASDGMTQTIANERVVEFAAE